MSTLVLALLKTIKRHIAALAIGDQEFPQSLFTRQGIDPLLLRCATVCYSAVYENPYHHSARASQSICRGAP